ncbi:MAG: hypothetical protein ACMXYE_03300 [Candidatus Woesearchaeota archaeon]
MASPRLSTIRMVEQALQSETVVTLAKLKSILPKQVNHYTLLEIISYLEESNKIVFGSKGMTWLPPKKRVGVEH